VYDVVFNPDTLAMGLMSPQALDQIIEVAMEAVQKNFKVKFFSSTWSSLSLSQDTYSVITYRNF
jgi:hypothetical protein